MISLRNFTDRDKKEFQQKVKGTLALDEIKELFVKWNEKRFEGKYFEMFAVVKDEDILGMVSLYQHSESVVSCGLEVFEDYRKQGVGSQAMLLAMSIAKDKGYKAILQQVRVDNVASITLNNKLGFETDGYVYKNKKGNDIFIYIKIL